MIDLAAVALEIDTCLLCRSGDLKRVVALEPLPIATPNARLVVNGFKSEDIWQPVPLNLNQCRDCGHVQVSHRGHPDAQYRDYIYTTATSVGLQRHFERYAAEVNAAIRPKPQSLVVDIGSNDGTLLRAFKALGFSVLGVEPGRRIAAQANASGIPTIPEFMTHRLAVELRERHGAASIVTANNVMSNIVDLDDYVRGIGHLLADDGVFVFEAQYGADVFERTLLDTVYHEHLSYFFVTPTRRFLERVGLQLIDLARNDSKGGSIRAIAQRRGASRPVSPVVEELAAREEAARCFASEYFTRFVDDVASIRRELAQIIAAERAAGRSVAGYGVSVGTTTMLAQLDLCDKIDFLIDDQPRDAQLVGPGYRIPVYKSEAIARLGPSTILIFAWRYAHHIMNNHAAFSTGGGRFIVPLPAVQMF